MSDLTLADFLLARIAEDEDTARRALEEAPGLTWVCEPVYDGVYSIDLGPATHPDTDSYGVGEDTRVPREVARHIEANSPARVLAECEAKRQIVELHRDSTWPWIDDPCCPQDGYPPSGPCETLGLLALPYADHADYRQEWRP